MNQNQRMPLRLNDIPSLELDIFQMRHPEISGADSGTTVGYIL